VLIKGIYIAIHGRLLRVGTPPIFCTTRAIRAGFIDAVAPTVGNIALMRRLGLRSAPWQARWR